MSVIGLASIQRSKSPSNVVRIYSRRSFLSREIRVAEPDGKDTFRKRLEKLRKELEFDGWDPMAEELRLLPDVSTQANHMSGWKKAPGAKLMMALAMLHPLDPKGCLKWLHEGGEMPRLHVDRNERGSGVHQPEVDRALALEAIEAVNRFAVELAEILRRDDQQPPEENGPAPEPAPEPRRPRVASTDLSERKRKLKEARGVGDREEEE